MELLQFLKRQIRVRQGVFDRQLPAYFELLSSSEHFPFVVKNPVKDRVLIVGPSLGGGGAERQMANTFCGLNDVEYGFESVTLLCDDIFKNKGNDHYLPLVKDVDAKVLEVPQEKELAEEWREENAPLSDVLPHNILDEILNLSKIIAELRPSIIYAWQDSTVIKVGMAAVLSRIPRIVLTARNLNPINFGYFQYYMWPAYRALAQQPNVQLLNNSAAGAADYARWLDLPVSSFQVLRNGVNLDHLRHPPTKEVTDFRTKMGMPEGVPVVGSVFRLYPEKRPLLWLKVAAQVLRDAPDAHFLHAGQGPMEEDVRKFARKLGIEKRIYFVGMVEDISLVYATMDIFLMTSRFEGTPNVILESQYMGVPVITTNVGGAAEAVNDGETGLVINSSNPSVLATKVVEVLKDPARRKTMGKRGFRFVMGRFGNDQMLSQTATIFRHRKRQPDHIKACLEAAQSFECPRLFLVVPYIVSKNQFETLYGNERLVEVIISGENSSSWQIPDGKRQTLGYCGDIRNINFRRLLAARKGGVSWVVAFGPEGWRKFSINRLLVNRKAVHLVVKSIIYLRHFWRFVRAAINRTKYYLTRLHLKFMYVTRLDKFSRSTRTYEKLISGDYSVSFRKWPPIARKVVIVGSNLEVGGAQRQLVNTATGISRQAKVEVICSTVDEKNASGFFLPLLKNAGVHISLISDHRLDGTLKSIETLLKLLPPLMSDAILDLAAEFRARRPMVVHGWLDSVNIVVGAAGIMAGVPKIILSQRSLNPSHFRFHEYYMRPFYQILARCQNIVLLNNSKAGASDYAHWLSIPRDRIRVVHNGVDLENLKQASNEKMSAFRSQFQIPPEAPVVGSIFRVQYEKRPKLWVEMAAYVSRTIPDAHFIIVGGSESNEEMKSFANKMGIGEKLHFRSSVRDISIPLSIMDVFVLTSRVEGLPNVTLEAQFLGTPVVACDVGGIKETIIPGDTGFVSAQAKGDALGRLVVKCLQDNEWREKCRKIAPQFISENFSMSKMIAETEEAYGWRSNAMDGN